MKNDLLKRYGGAVPRYTSYPTAPHFHDGVSAQSYADWLGGLDQGTTLSLYLHVPFCQRMCWYCGCHTKITARYDPIHRYAQSLAGEIELVAGALGERRRVSHVHWGGGTPTTLAAADFAALIARLGTHFDIRADSEIAVEIDPRTLSREMVSALAKSSVNRASLGIQDFDPDVQRAINRIQPLAETRRRVAWLRAAGIDNISFDLMYGLPRQTEQSVRRTVDLAVSIRPNRLSIFGYAHVPWMKSHQRMIDADALAGADARMSQMNAIAERLAEHGYHQIGFDHFARDEDEMTAAQETGILRRNFQGYTTDQAPALIGLGASAIGSLPAGYVQNETAIGRYETEIGAGRLATVRGIAVSGEDRMRRRIIESFM
ncbi:MAG: oxygen-independent coproporphyrinogen III oxidase, partial [Rhodospirillaceae bacterium]|nr:oxygen-independent coproporphyrinogen III oxidase [Rhodospirillaceae bacterium]